MAPTLPPLVTAADMAAYGYPPASDAVLARASARVRRYTGQQITRGTSTVTLNGVGPWLLPQRPVVAVTSAVDADGQPVAFEVRGQHVYVDGCPPVTVTYEHGWDQLPDGLVEVVCQIANRLATQPDAVASGVRQESAGGEAITWSVEALEGSAGLTPAERKALDGFFPRWPRTVMLR